MRRLGKCGSALKMDDTEFDEFQRSVVLPMIRRHEAMFPQMHRRVSSDPWQSRPSLQANSSMAAPAKAYAGTAPYAPCPCNSGKKYKFCCGVKRR